MHNKIEKGHACIHISKVCLYLKKKDIYMHIGREKQEKTSVPCYTCIYNHFLQHIMVYYLQCWTSYREMSHYQHPLYTKRRIVYFLYHGITPLEQAKLLNILVMFVYFQSLLILIGFQNNRRNFCLPLSFNFSNVDHLGFQEGHRTQF